VGDRAPSFAFNVAIVGGVGWERGARVTTITAATTTVCGIGNWDAFTASAIVVAGRRLGAQSLHRLSIS